MNYALITGASSGIGLEYARQLAAMGHHLIVVSNQRETNVTVATELAELYGISAIPLYADLSRPEAAADIYNYCQTANLHVDILICNAGMLHFGKLVHTDQGTVNRIVTLHCTTPAQLCQRFAQEMCKQHEGHILLMSSMAAWTPFPTMSLYGATKVFLRNFGKSLWYELHDEGVSVTTVYPSAVDTQFFNINENARRRLRLFGLIISPERLVEGALGAMFSKRRRYIPDLWTRLEIGCCQLVPTRLFLLFMRLPAIRKILNKV